MVKIKLSYKNESDKIRILSQLSKGNSIKQISKTYKEGELFRVYIEIE